MDFDSLNVLSLNQLVSKRDIYANEWEVDSLESLPNIKNTVVKVEPRIKKVEKVNIR